MTAFLYELWIFFKKQVSALAFAFPLLFFIVLTKYYYPFVVLQRYDFLLICALVIQIILLLKKIESFREVKIIFLFHFIGVLMEIFKTHPDIGSWIYPGDSVFKIFTVPLFSGFMYSAVGSYLFRCLKIFKIKFTKLPSIKILLILSFIAYLNFFTKHFFWDIRYILIVLILIILRSTSLQYIIWKKIRKIHIIVTFSFIAFFIWIAEQIATFSRIWLYPYQYETWQWIGSEKIVSWWLLFFLSFSLIIFFRGKKN